MWDELVSFFKTCWVHFFIKSTKHWFLKIFIRSVWGNQIDVAQYEYFLNHDLQVVKRMILILMTQNLIALHYYVKFLLKRNPINVS
jgi:hypothetical protein